MKKSTRWIAVFEKSRHQRGGVAAGAGFWQYRNSLSRQHHCWLPDQYMESVRPQPLGLYDQLFFRAGIVLRQRGNMRPVNTTAQTGGRFCEFKEMVKAFHSNQVAVILDVVYNHVSQYDHNPYKYIDKFYYFRLKPNCDFESASGCGNDFKTERPMAGGV